MLNGCVNPKWIIKKSRQDVSDGDVQVGKVGEGEIVEGEVVVGFELGHQAEVVGEDAVLPVEV